MDRKKELREKYKQMKPDMGIMIVRSTFDNKCHLERTPDLKGRINRTDFALNYGGHPVKELQKAWKEHGGQGFVIEVLEILPYDKEDEGRTDYREDLEVLQAMCEERLTAEGMEFYK